MIPEPLLSLLKQQYGGETERILSGYASQRLVSLRVNALKTNAVTVCGALDRAGVAWSAVPWYRDALILENAREDVLRATELYTRGEIYLQSLSSMIPPLVLQPEAGETILDMTAAPGGKTSQMAALSGGRALITACERDKTRFSRLKFNLERQGAPRVTAICTDAALLDDGFSFDKILLDAPCSGSGTIAPGTPVRITEPFLEKLNRTQTKLLRKAYTLLKRGGTMVYSTCSVLRRENEDILHRALSGTDAKLERIGGFEGVPRLPSEEGTLCVCPSERYEGFFVAKIKKG